MATIMIIGDVGGCAEELAGAVAGAAAGTIVVQVGDLVDRGPDSPGVLSFVAGRLTSGSWVQLIGNHEGQHLSGEPFWPEPLAESDAELLRTWWRREQMRVAAAVRTADGAEFLLSHAGLTVDAWRKLGSPVTAATAADLLNTRPEELLWDFGGPLWAGAAAEVYASWLATPEPVPFGQIHGHSAIVDYADRRWVCGERIRARSTVDWAERRTVTRIGAQDFIAVDPKHGRTGAPQWAPLILENAELIA